MGFQAPKLILLLVLMSAAGQVLVLGWILLQSKGEELSLNSSTGTVSPNPVNCCTRVIHRVIRVLLTYYETVFAVGCYSSQHKGMLSQCQ